MGNKRLKGEMERIENVLMKRTAAPINGMKSFDLMVLDGKRQSLKRQEKESS